MSVVLNGSIYLQNTNNEDWGNTGSIFIRLKPGWAQTDGAIHQILTKGPATVTNAVFTFFKYSTNALVVGWVTPALDARIVTSATVFNLETWDNHLFLWNTVTPFEEYWHNGTLIGQFLTSAVTVPTALTHFTLGCYFSAASTVYPADALFAEFGRWNRALTASEIAVLQATGCPLSVPIGLRQYHPLIHPVIEGVDRMGRVPLTPIGTHFGYPHPRVYYSAAGYAPSLQATPAALEVQPPAVSNLFSIFAPSISLAGIIAAPLLSNPFQTFAPSVSLTGEQFLDVPLIASSFTIFAPSVNVQETTIQEDSRELEPHNLRVRVVDFVSGDDLRISRLYTDLAQGILISKAYLTIKRYAKDVTDAEAIIQKTITSSEQMSGKIVDGDTTGGSIQLYFDLSNTETALLIPLVPYQYDIQVITTGNAIYTCEKGVIVMAQGVTAATS